MTKSILVPIDISSDNAGASAIPVAQDLARSNGGKVTLLNVVEHVGGYTRTYLPEDYCEQAAAEAKTILADIAAKHDLPKDTDIAVREGVPASEILAHAKAIKADIIVLPSHDPGLADFFLGSVAARVVRHAHCSVMVVRKTK